jgi:hypothetical protein
MTQLVNEAATRKALYDSPAHMRLGDGAFKVLNAGAAAIVQHYTVNVSAYPVTSNEPCNEIVLKTTVLETLLKAHRLPPPYRARVHNCICYVLKHTVDLATTLARDGLPLESDVQRAFDHVWNSVKKLTSEKVPVKVPRARIAVSESPDEQQVE